MDQIKLENLMQESRLISAADNVLYPLIKLKIENRLNLAIGKFHNGETSFISDIAYIVGLREIEQQLRKMQTAGNKANLELNKDMIK